MVWLNDSVKPYEVYLLHNNIEDSRSWYDTLKSVLQTYRSTIHPALGKSPYEMVFGNKMKTK